MEIYFTPHPFKSIQQAFQLIKNISAICHNNLPVENAPTNVDHIFYSIE